MTRLVSLGVQLAQLGGLRDMGDLSDWESDFVASVASRVRRADGKTSVLSDKQVETIADIWLKHFA